MTQVVDAPDRVALSSAAGRWVVLATVLGTGMALLDTTVVNVALPSVQRDLGGGLSGLQWVLDGYLLTLGSLLLLGGSLGDRYGRRRVFVVGLVAFSLASAVCGLAPSVGLLVAARMLQGVGGALLVPGSLALLSAAVRTEDRGRAVGTWSGLAGVTSAIGPFVGGWLVDTVSWRLVFLINVPLAALAVMVTVRHVPDSRGLPATGPPDALGALLVAGGLGGVVYALIEGAAHGVGAVVLAAGVAGVAALAGFLVVERRAAAPMVPLEVFRSRQFSGANATTLAVYAALGGALFLLAFQLQTGLGYSALAAGAALVPVTLLMLVLSPRAGALAQRVGPRLPMTLGPCVVAVGLVLMGRVQPGATYLGAVLPAVIVFGLGLSATVAPLTATVLGAVDEDLVGVGSGVNNAVARVASLLAVALLPAVAGVGTQGQLGPGFGRAMDVAAGLAVLGGLVALLTIRRGAPATSSPAPAA